MQDKPKRMTGWSIPDAPPEIRRVAVAEAKRRGLKLHEFIARAIMLALDHGGVLSDKYDIKALNDLDDKHDKHDKFDEVLARLTKIETVLNLPKEAETEAEAPPAAKTKPKRVRVKPQKPPQSASDEA